MANLQATLLQSSQAIVIRQAVSVSPITVSVLREFWGTYMRLWLPHMSTQLHLCTGEFLTVVMTVVISLTHSAAGTHDPNYIYLTLFS